MATVTPRQLRAVRGVAAAAVTTMLAATAHTLGGDGAPSPLLVAVAAVLAAPLATALVGRRPSVLRTSAAVLSAQAVFHVVFALLGTESGIVYGPMDHATHLMAMTTTSHTMTGHGVLPDGPMLAAHLVAALVTILLLHRGERVLGAIARGIRRLVRVAGAPVPSRPRELVQVAPDAPALFRRAFGSDLTRRGPPLSFC